MERTDIRLALPSKGILQDGTLEFLEACGLRVFRPNPRQYAATIPALPDVTVKMCIRDRSSIPPAARQPGYIDLTGGRPTCQVFYVDLFTTTL